VRARAIRARWGYSRALCAMQESVSSFIIMTVLTLSISLFPSLLTKARANAYV
jgi:hypothetical protein